MWGVQEGDRYWVEPGGHRLYWLWRFHPPQHTLREGDTKGQKHSRSHDQYDSWITRLGLPGYLSIIFLIHTGNGWIKVCSPISYTTSTLDGRTSAVAPQRTLEGITLLSNIPGFVLLPDGSVQSWMRLSCTIIYVILADNKLESPGPPTASPLFQPSQTTKTEVWINSKLPSWKLLM